MKTCSTCRFWFTEESLAHVTRRGWNWCNHEKLSEPMGYIGGEDALVYSYDEGGGFETGPAFGCVHHVARAQSASEMTAGECDVTKMRVTDGIYQRDLTAEEMDADVVTVGPKE